MQSLAFRAAPDRTAPCPTLRDFDLGGAKPILPRGRSVSCSLLNQQAFRLEEEFEVNHGFHRTPLVPGYLEAVKYVSRQAWPGRLNVIFRINPTASVVRRSTTGGLVRIRSSGSIGKSGMAT